MSYYNVTSDLIVTDALVATWASNNSINDANYWLKVPNKRRKYVVSSTLLSRRDARATYYSPVQKPDIA